MGSGSSVELETKIREATDADLKEALAGLTPDGVAKLKASLAMSKCICPLSDEGKKILADNGWDKGCVGFGNPASEATVKLLSALLLLKKAHTWIEISFDDAALADNKMGVKSNDYKLITGGVSAMPALSKDGTMHVESVKIVKMLAEESNAPKEVMDIINLVDANDARLLEAAKHWGWAGLHAAQDYVMVNKEHYTSYGMGNKDEAWEKETAGVVKTFLDKLESILTAKSEINGFYVGDTLTLADCVLCNWPLTLGKQLLGVDIENKYPKVWENYQKLKEKTPEGMSIHFEAFPGFCGYVEGANKENRDKGFVIGKYL